MLKFWRLLRSLDPHGKTTAKTWLTKRKKHKKALNKPKTIEKKFFFAILKRKKRQKTQADLMGASRF